MSHKKLGLFLLPLVPLTAIGIVEVADELVSLTKPAPVAVVDEPRCALEPLRPEPPPPPAPIEAGPQTVIST